MPGTISSFPTISWEYVPQMVKRGKWSDITCIQKYSGLLFQFLK